MIRFRNSGSNPETQVGVLKLLYNDYQDNKAFNLRDMANTLAKGHLLSSNGYTGSQAVVAGYSDNSSKNSPLMASKLYAEIFRMMGWLVPSTADNSYPVVLSYLGAHIAKTQSDWAPLYEQCIMGIVTPTDLTANVIYTEKSRVLYAILLYAEALDSFITKQEICMGPMSHNDYEENCLENSCIKLRQDRWDKKRMNERFDSFAKKLGIQSNSVINCTRFPIAALKTLDLIKKATIKEGNSSHNCFRLTEKGKALLSEYKMMKDLRLDEYRTYQKDIQKALIRIGFYSMLDRAGYDISSVETVIAEDKILCRDILMGKELLFSPYQMLQRREVDIALGVTKNVSETASANIKKFEKKEEIASTFVQVNCIFSSSPFLKREDALFIEAIRDRAKNTCALSLVHDLMHDIKLYDQANFYPYVSMLFRIIGFNCELSRAGDNGNRWDAMIIDSNRSIPIEIKSPRESEVLTLKAIRQALENKIILLSRKSFATSTETTSLAVCYNLPYETAEAQRLIEDIYETFGFRIGVIEVESLIKAALCTIIKGKSIAAEEIYNLKGFMYANI